jgi:predicted TIM-barrel fold metal-dependent hydrolase
MANRTDIQKLQGFLASTLVSSVFYRFAHGVYWPLWLFALESAANVAWQVGLWWWLRHQWPNFARGLLTGLIVTAPAYAVILSHSIR